MTWRCSSFLLVAAWLAVTSAQALAQDSDRDAAADRIARGVAAFRAGDSIGATRQWSEAIRLAQQAGDADLEAQALARRGEAYRIAGALNDAGTDLRAALAKAETAGDQTLIAATSGALGNVELVLQHPDAAEKLLTRSLGRWPRRAATISAIFTSRQAARRRRGGPMPRPAPMPRLSAIRC